MTTLLLIGVSKDKSKGRQGEAARQACDTVHCVQPPCGASRQATPTLACTPPLHTNHGWAVTIPRQEAGSHMVTHTLLSNSTAQSLLTKSGMRLIPLAVLCAQQSPWS